MLCTQCIRGEHNSSLTSLACYQKLEQTLSLEDLQGWLVTRNPVVWGLNSTCLG